MDVLKCKLTAWATRLATVGLSGGPGSTIVLWYVHPSHRRRKVAARRLPIADSRAYRGCGAKSGWGCTHWKAPPCHGAHRGVHYDAFNAAFGNLLQINDLPANPTQGPEVPTTVPIPNSGQEQVEPGGGELRIRQLPESVWQVAPMTGARGS